ncbi:MAG: GyrI-like domain-containing protein [Candidatus Aminicenantes bacterium]|nr:GyrI-like domain-containing protein [Candidatus Aminicenantes bacterium]
MEHDFKVVELKERPALAIRETVANADIPAKMRGFFVELWMFIKGRNVEIAGPPFALYHSWNDRETVMEVGFPVGPGAAGEGRIQAMALPGGKTVTGMHFGPYDKLQASYHEMVAWMKANGHEPAGKMWETYLTDPEMEKDPAKWMTQMFWPVA